MKTRAENYTKIFKVYYVPYLGISDIFQGRVDDVILIYLPSDLYYLNYHPWTVADHWPRILNSDKH